MRTKVLAIYLPQFHRIPENDEWWGEGFTEWTNVKRGRPFYPGHYQPREPLGDNYYDLSDLKVLEKHTKMAAKAGIYGFCFYHYYSQGNKLLEMPIENYRDNSKEKFPYCLIWANQTWARTWYRAKTGNKVLWKQNYGEQNEWENHFLYLLSFFKDERYIKVGNKPVYIIYLPQDIHYKQPMFELWDSMAKVNGFDGLYLIAMNTCYGKDENARLYDAYMDFEPLFTIQRDNSWRKWLQGEKINRIQNQRIEGKSFWNLLLANNSYSYDYVARRSLKRFRKSDVKTYGGIFAGWDNTARRDEEGMIVTGTSPRKFGRAVRKILYMSEKQGKEFVFINAWNEWSEGAYLEPDKKYRYGFLNILHQEIQKLGGKRDEKRNNSSFIGSCGSSSRHDRNRKGIGG